MNKLLLTLIFIILFAGNVKTKVYYTLDNPKVKEIPEEDIIYFHSEKSIEQLGYTKCE